MTPDALRAALAALGLTQTAFASYLGVHRLTVHGWCTGKLAVPRYIEVIVELMSLLDALDPDYRVSTGRKREG